ncbi:hypothetical protein BH20ACT16_BH20ACT16_03260 [soil metagenome]
MSLRSVIPARLRRALAVALRTRRAAWRAAREPRRDAAEIFDEVYSRNIWGTGETAYYSGGGSDTRFAVPYCQAVRSFVDELHIERPVIVDLGCGDFRVGQALVEDWDVDYVGLDVVPAMIEHHEQHHAREGVRFVCADVVAENLPPGAVCLVRQVLQHLSNDQIRTVLTKLERYPHVLVTEHYPADETTAIPNLGKALFADARLAENSGVYLDRPPYSPAVPPPLAMPAEPGEIRIFALAAK